MNIINQVTSENYDQLLKRVLKKAYKMTNTSKKRAVNVILISNEKIKELNLKYRQIDDITDVLTFPSEEENELGDIFIALHVAIEQARNYHHDLNRELAFLTIHGFLHALGYDHDTQENENAMFEQQDKILNALNITR